jgi:hypothetical protein
VECGEYRSSLLNFNLTIQIRHLPPILPLPRPKKLLKQLPTDMRSATAKLLSEFTNEEATARLEAKLGEIPEQLVPARKLNVNKKHKQQTKRRIENMTTFRSRAAASV